MDNCILYTHHGYVYVTFDKAHRAAVDTNVYWPHYYNHAIRRTLTGKWQVEFYSDGRGYYKPMHPEVEKITEREYQRYIAELVVQ